MFKLFCFYNFLGEKDRICGGVLCYVVLKVGYYV